MGNGMRDALEETGLFLRLNLSSSFFFFIFFFFHTLIYWNVAFLNLFLVLSFLDMILSIVIWGVDCTPQVLSGVHGCFFFDQ